MTNRKYKLAKVQGGPGSHELKNGKVVTYDQTQTFDPEKEGLLPEWVELVE